MATPAMLTQPNGMMPPGGFGASGMPGLRKAAILMVAVGDELAKVFFKSLSDTDVQRVADEIARLGEVPQAQLTQVLMEFYGLLETEQYMVRGGPEYAHRLPRRGVRARARRGASGGDAEDARTHPRRSGDAAEDGLAAVEQVP